MQRGYLSYKRLHWFIGHGTHLGTGMQYTIPETKHSELGSTLPRRGSLRFPTLVPEHWCRHYTYYLSYVWASDKLVQDALHVRQGTIKKWVRCNSSISYDEDAISTIAHHRNLTKKSLRALIYRR